MATSKEGDKEHGNGHLAMNTPRSCRSTIFLRTRCNSHIQQHVSPFFGGPGIQHFEYGTYPAELPATGLLARKDFRLARDPSRIGGKCQ
jgi:hypothetical protein